MTPRIPTLFDCPAEFTLRLLGGKWKTVIMCHLHLHPMRYGELRRLLPRLSDKVLTERLRELVEVGLVAHTPRAGGTRVATYRLSARGESLRPVLVSVNKWGLEHRNLYGVRFRSKA